MRRVLHEARAVNVHIRVRVRRSRPFEPSGARKMSKMWKCGTNLGELFAVRNHSFIIPDQPDLDMPRIEDKFMDAAVAQATQQHELMVDNVLRSIAPKVIADKALLAEWLRDHGYWIRWNNAREELWQESYMIGTFITECDFGFADDVLTSKVVKWSSYFKLVEHKEEGTE